MRGFRSVCTFWAAERSLAHLEAIRLHELDLVLRSLPPRARILEIGAGTGWQARALEHRGYEVEGIDLAQSEYHEQRVWRVSDYDGKRIPFPDRSFDVVFSSNALEHIPHIRAFQQELQRVLEPDGFALHVLPSSTWRVWSTLTYAAHYWRMPRPHGEHAGNALSEVHYFSRRWWRRLFHETGWTVVREDSNRLFYTGESIMDSRLSIPTRARLSRVLGSSCNILVLRKAERDGTERDATVAGIDR